MKVCNIEKFQEDRKELCGLTVTHVKLHVVSLNNEQMNKLYNKLIAAVSEVVNEESNK